MKAPRRKSRSTPAPRRSAQQWAKLVAAWRDSGDDVETFAARRQVSARGLRWWRWRLGPPTHTTTPVPVELRLVPVSVAEDPAARAAAMPAWELCAPSGHILRVHQDLDGVLLERALTHLAGRA